MRGWAWVFGTLQNSVSPSPSLPPSFQDISSCNTTPVEGAESGDDSLVYLCSALSQEDGTFTFPSLASGEYSVVGRPKMAAAIFIPDDKEKRQCF